MPNSNAACQSCRRKRLEEPLEGWCRNDEAPTYCAFHKPLTYADLDRLFATICHATCPDSCYREQNWRCMKTCSVDCHASNGSNPCPALEATMANCPLMKETK